MTNAEQNPRLVVKKIIRAGREKVFDAWTNPELMQKWFFPGSWSAKTTNQLRVGGTYSHEMITNGTASACTPGYTPGNSEHHLHYGEYIEISRPERLVFTWNSSIIANSRVTVEFKDIDGSTELTLTHELLGTEESKQQHSAGWAGCLDNLENFFA